MKKQLENIIKQYIQAFEKKQKMNFEFAVSDDYLGILSFGCIYYFSASDVVFDIDNNLPKHLICDWLIDSLENEGNYINLQSYAGGLRHSDLHQVKTINSSK